MGKAGPDFEALRWPANDDDTEAQCAFDAAAPRLFADPGHAENFRVQAGEVDDTGTVGV